MIESKIKFKIEARCGKARTGTLNTTHGAITTPVFMPVGTKASVKSLAPEQLLAAGTSILLCNTYHLHLRPGENIIHNLGGLQRFMSWNRPILTDSGGYQIYSLAKLSKISDEGVSFKSHIDGRLVELSPERAIAIQTQLGSDIMMCLDHLCAANADDNLQSIAIERTTRWAQRCLESLTPDSGALFGIVQGGINADLRQRSARQIVDLGFAGYALGGLGVGETATQRQRTIELTASLLPDAQPRYLMGSGEPEDILSAIGYGVDMFDCVLPTRNARNGCIYTTQGKLSIKKACYQSDPLPLDEHCACATCQNYSRAYLRHLFKNSELLYYALASQHNLYFFHQLLQQARTSIVSGSFADFVQDFFASYYSAPPSQ